MRRLLLLLITLLPACTTNFTTGQPIFGFAPLTASDGSKSWRFIGPWKLNSHEDELFDAISLKIAEVHWCTHGWEIDSREKHVGLLVVHGHCKSG